LALLGAAEGRKKKGEVCTRHIKLKASLVWQVQKSLPAAPKR
jgi:hypothetical protein